jgi:hypothetical protein
MLGKVCQRHRHAIRAACRADCHLVLPVSLVPCLDGEVEHYGDTGPGVENL